MSTISSTRNTLSRSPAGTPSRKKLRCSTSIKLRIVNARKCDLSFSTRQSTFHPRVVLLSCLPKFQEELCPAHQVGLKQLRDDLRVQVPQMEMSLVKLRHRGTRAIINKLIIHAADSESSKRIRQLLRTEFLTLSTSVSHLGVGRLRGDMWSPVHGSIITHYLVGGVMVLCMKRLWSCNWMGFNGKPSQVVCHQTKPVHLRLIPVHLDGLGLKPTRLRSRRSENHVSAHLLFNS